MGRSTILLWFALALLVVCSALAEAPAEQLLSNAPDLGNSLVESSSLQDQRQSLKERELLLLSQRESEDRERASIERLVLDVESRPLLPVENSPLSGLYVNPLSPHCDSLALMDPNYTFCSDILAEFVFGTRTPSLNLDSRNFQVRP